MLILLKTDPSKSEEKYVVSCEFQQEPKVRRHQECTGIRTLEVNDNMEIQISEKLKVGLKKECQIHMHINSKRNTFGLSWSFCFSFQSKWQNYSQQLLVIVPKTENCDKVVYGSANLMT